MNKKIIWSTKSFNEFSIEELYDVLNLRCKVFVVEQEAPYLDLDYKDQKALHVQLRIEGKLVAYCRLFQKGDYFEEASIGRVVIDESYRGFGYGHQLIDYAIRKIESCFNQINITISAQCYLQHFYENHGFNCIGDVYLEDNIPHVRMRKGVAVDFPI